MVIFQLCLSLIIVLLKEVSTEYIGLQSGPQKSIPILSKFLSPEDFFKNYVIPGTPVLFKGVAKEFPAYTKWTDDYFKSLPESKDYTVAVEEGKKENRNDPGRDIPFSQFVDIYKDDDIYYVDRVPEFLASDMPLPQPLNCPFVYNNLLADNVMWFSSGGTKSLWHNDGYENLNCLMRGKKWFIMANKNETVRKAHIDVENGSYSTVDVENVDVKKYPGFKDIQFYNATLEAGDCLYIPWLWFHHVNSIGSNLAVNVWWRPYRTPLECEESTPLTFNQVDFRLAEPGFEGGSGTLAEDVVTAIYRHDHMYTATEVDKQTFSDSVNDALDYWNIRYVKEKDIMSLFDRLDSDKDGVLSYIEVDTMHFVLPKFMLLFKDEL